MSARWVLAVSLVLGLKMAPGLLPAALNAPAGVGPRGFSEIPRAEEPPPADVRDRGVFVRTLTLYKGRLWVGTFNDGFLAIDQWTASDGLERAHPVATQFRMINDALEANGALYVAANEGLFFTRDGARFERAREVGARGATALAFDGGSLFATTTSALWRVRVAGGGPPNAVWWKPAGSRSLQGVVAERGMVWLASEDRGAIRFDGQTFTAYDKLAGLPTSWVVAITGDGKGGVFEATLRDGAMHVDSAGHWQPMQGLPSAWTLSVSHGPRGVCVGTRGGAACYGWPTTEADPWRVPSCRLEALPDPRAHAFLNANDTVLVGTEAGMTTAPCRPESARDERQPPVAALP